jgi:hypothetical protein
MRSRVDLSELRPRARIGQGHNSSPPSLYRYHQLGTGDIGALLLRVDFLAALLRRYQGLLRRHPLVNGLE